MSDSALNAVAFADHPAAAEEAGQAGFAQSQADGSEVGAGAGVAGLLQVVEQGLQGGEIERGAVADVVAAGDRHLSCVQIPAEAEF